MTDWHLALDEAGALTVKPHPGRTRDLPAGT